MIQILYQKELRRLQQQKSDELQKRMKLSNSQFNNMDLKIENQQLKIQKIEVMSNAYIDGKKYQIQIWLKDPGPNKKIQLCKKQYKNMVQNIGQKQQNIYLEEQESSVGKDDIIIQTQILKNKDELKKKMKQLQWHTKFMEINDLQLVNQSLVELIMLQKTIEIVLQKDSLKIMQLQKK